MKKYELGYGFIYRGASCIETSEYYNTKEEALKEFNRVKSSMCESDSYHYICLSENTYDNDNIFRVSVASMLSGYALSKSKYLKTLSTIFKESKVFSYSAIICIIISTITVKIIFT